MKEITEITYFWVKQDINCSHWLYWQSDEFEVSSMMEFVLIL